MANEVQASPDQSTTSLVKGIISDFGDLIRQEVRFARAEVKADLQKTTEAATVLAIGVGTLALGVLLLAVMLVYLLYWLANQSGTDPANNLPLWACFGIVSAIFLATGSALTWLGYRKFESFNPLPDETAQTVKENVEWIMNSK
jgi:hypothetical protein